MEIVIHIHDADISERMRQRAELALRKAARRAARPQDGVIRFQQDGTVRRVEMTLHTAGGRRYVAKSDAPYFGSALTDAARKLAMQLDHQKRTPKARARKQGRKGSA
jgi:ribosome-associated translation inhibitor RaiA